MRRGWLVPLFLSVLQASPAARTACIPADEVAERMDGYFADPRGPDTYRALSGLGDPRIPRRFAVGREDRPLFGEPEDREGDEALRKRMFPAGGTELGGSSYQWVEKGDCRAGYALSVARERIASLGARHPYVEKWFAVQRAVFGACAGGGGKAVALPAPLPTADPRIARLQRDDRAYQAASRLFYDGSPAAAAAFRRIAGSASRHAPVARYMLLVLMAERPGPAQSDAEPAPRAGDPPPMVFVGEERAPRPDAAAIVAEANRILADPKLASIHPLTQGLIGSLAWRAARRHDRREDDPPDPAVALLLETQVRLTLDALRLPAERLRSDPLARELYARAAADVGSLHRRFDDPAWWRTGTVPSDAYGSRAMAAAARNDRFAAWLLFAQSPFRTMAWGRAGRSLNWSGLRGVTNSGHSADRLAWEVADAAGAPRPAGWGDLDQMVAEAAACPTESRLAALPELLYHRVRGALMYCAHPDFPKSGFAHALERLAAWPWKASEHHRETVAAALRYLVEVGRIAEARMLRDRLLPAAQPDPRNDMALLLLAEDETRLAAALTGDAHGDRQPLLNMLSVPALQRLAARGDVPREDAARFARVAWARLYALGRPVPARLDRLMRRLNPELTAGWRSKPGRGKAGDRTLLLDVLRAPGLNILLTNHQRPVHGGYGETAGLNAIDTFEHSDNNWWCAWEPQRHEQALDRLLYHAFFSGPAEAEEDVDPLAVAGARPTLAPLLEASWLWKARDEAEVRALAVIPSAPKLLAGRAIAWASRSGKAAEQAEALALAVRATRYGCQRQGGHGAYSRAAFELLHRRFGGSEAARRTRYWFDCAHFSGGCSRPRRPEE